MSEIDSERFTDDRRSLLRSNLDELEHRINMACVRAGRRRSEVRLLPVSKRVPSAIVRMASELGLSNFGENKVQEAEGKVRDLADLSLDWSIIGHLQTNKVKSMVNFASEFHALDSLRLADALQVRLGAEGRRLDVFVQVNTSGEESKYGLSPNEVAEFVRRLPDYPALIPRGFMTLAIFSGDAAKVRECFKLLRQLRDALRDRASSGLNLLSMGMTSDFEMAIEEGADVIRVGQAIFGSRPTKDGHYWPRLLRGNEESS
ncbi:YggS family pyridoxal phosphate-dependent enzyme [Bradyrhizobium sp. 139]|uniref:YggS family pyridoxal phosphate-dependent enzyme n=1 Tax=Bradyrhizobium sp. 139 TaxID=2782616 RepID=UPI001FF8BC12|nr:YggS family pyridoxal phosphate-dependent enzyme [Bradyrhizobium sp. 139]MCK1741093.1 YggS family pyridoxal phosphate-dependent enzyme [Bradyrhizobium sp. 139]